MMFMYNCAAVSCFTSSNRRILAIVCEKCKTISSHQVINKKLINYDMLRKLRNTFMSTNILKDAVPLHAYWENHTPSHIDLRKHKYGGPFTYEQVEDVKTLFRLLLLILFYLVFNYLEMAIY